jgi:hypothetical protein
MTSASVTDISVIIETQNVSDFLIQISHWLPNKTETQPAVVSAGNPSTQEMRQEDLRFKARLGCIVKPCLKKT